MFDFTQVIKHSSFSQLYLSPWALEFAEEVTGKNRLLYDITSVYFHINALAPANKASRLASR